MLNGSCDLTKNGSKLVEYFSIKFKGKLKMLGDGNEMKKCYEFLMEKVPGLFDVYRLKLFSSEDHLQIITKMEFNHFANERKNSNC